MNDELCQVSGCLMDAAFYPILKLYTKNSNDPAEVKIMYPVCIGHTNTLTLEQLLPNDQWLQLVNFTFVQNGLVAPVKERTQIEWISMQLREEDTDNEQPPSTSLPPGQSFDSQPS